MDNIDDLLNLMRVEQQNRIYVANHEDFDDYIYSQIEKTKKDKLENENSTQKPNPLL